MEKQLSHLVVKVFNEFSRDYSKEKTIELQDSFISWFENKGNKYMVNQANDLKILDSRKQAFDEIKENIKKAIEKYYDEKGNASHYNENRLNSIVKFERIYGTYAVMTFCEITAERYRERIGKKDNQSLEQEVLKIKWYENAAKYFYKKLWSNDCIEIDNKFKEELPWEKE